MRRTRSVPFVLEDVAVFTGEQDFDIEDLDSFRQNRFIPEWNFKGGNYIRQIVGETFDDLHDTAKEHSAIRCPWWRKHQGNFPSYKPSRGYSRSQKESRRANELWWYGAPNYSLFGPLQNVGWSADGLSLQAEVPVPKCLRSITSANGETWNFNCFDATDKGTMWITVARRGSSQ